MFDKIMKYLIVLILFLPFSLQSKEITMQCSLSKVMSNGDEIKKFTPSKRFLKYKDSLVSKRDILQKHEGEWFSWCTDEATEYFNNYFKEKNAEKTVIKSERVLKKLSGRCEESILTKKGKSINVVNVDFEFLERKDDMTVFNEDEEIIKKFTLYYKCEQTK